jgi:hypothetical protein
MLCPVNSSKDYTGQPALAGTLRELSGLQERGDVLIRGQDVPLSPNECVAAHIRSG